MKKTLLAGLTPAAFLRRHWQKKPLFAPAALRESAGAITRTRLFELAARDDVESRVVIRARGRWTVEHGPFRASELRRMPRRGWTLLVHGVDQVDRQAARLPEAFAFIPRARFDDLLVSYAAPGGGVGPHFDSYDVFLVQSAGRRRWQVSGQSDLDLVEDAPLKLLARFDPAFEVTAAPGDVLYLPPQYAHDGVAIDECITCSVGFRAPSRTELATHFFQFLEDRLAGDALYADPDLEPAGRAARIPNALIEHTTALLEELRWSAADVLEFLGRYLTEPKAHVVFTPPRPTLTPVEFASRASKAGVRLALPTRMLFRGRRVFVNGESVRVPAASAARLATLADERALEPPLRLPREARALLYTWYAAGYVEIAR